MIVRPMQASDLDRVLEIADRLPSAPRWARDIYEAALQPGSAPKRIALVAVDSEQKIVIGFAVASVVLHEAELETIAVVSDHQREGVGRGLLAEICRNLSQLGVTKVTLEVRASNNPARGLYSSYGFVEAGQRPSYYIDPKEDALILVLVLPEHVGLPA